MVAVTIPEWAQAILAGYEVQETPFQECEIASALNNAARSRRELDAEDRKGWLSEWSAFAFGANRLTDSVWGTFFLPMMTRYRADGTPLHSPDIRDLDLEIITRWEDRAKNCGNPVMRARYADLVWDTKNTVTGERPNIEFARIAIGSYLDAVQQKRYTHEMSGVDWLARALQLARSTKNQQGIQRSVELMFLFYDEIADQASAGTWVFLFDILYGEDCISSEQEAQIVEQLETMFANVTDTNPGASGICHSDAFAAEAAAERLLRHYRKGNDQPNIRRVIKTFGACFEDMISKADSLAASVFLPRIIARYQQEGMKEDVERAQLLAQKIGKNIASNMKEIRVEGDLKKEDLDNLVANLVQPGDLNTSLERIAGYFIPDVDSARTILKRLETDAPLLSMFPVSFVDADGNPTAAMGALDDDADGRLYEQLGRSMGFYQPILMYTLQKLREALPATADEVLTFLSKSPVFDHLRKTSCEKA